MLLELHGARGARCGRVLARLSLGCWACGSAPCPIEVHRGPLSFFSGEEWSSLRDAYLLSLYLCSSEQHEKHEAMPGHQQDGQGGGGDGRLKFRKAFKDASGRLRAYRSR